MPRSYQNNPPKTEYQKSIFNPPLSSGYFSRILFYSFNRRLRKIFTGNDLRDLARSLALLALLVLFSLFLVSTNITDLRVFFVQGYELPSRIYALDEEGHYRPVAEFYRFDRRLIKLPEGDHAGLNRRVSRAFIAVEDDRFEDHVGVDLQGILRASVVNALAGRIKEGASTITQQAARLRFLSNERSVARKMREAFLAFLMELKYSKTKILEIYLNEVPLGHGTIGVEAASRFYFEKSHKDLRWGEAAVLASLTTRPSAYSPLRNPENSRSKVRVVFRKLVESGILSVEEAEKEYLILEDEYYRNLNRSPNDTAFNRRLNLHPYVSEYVKVLLPRKFRRKLYTGGLRIYTTIREEHQHAAEEIFIPYLNRLTRERTLPPFRHFDAFDDEMGDLYRLSSLLLELPQFTGTMSRDERKFQRSFTHNIRDEIMVLNKLGGSEFIGDALDYHLQNSARAVDPDPSLEGSLVSLRPVSGEITAVVGGSGFTSKNQMLRFIQSRRQPGSSFKPILYSSGIEYTGENIGGDPDLQPLTAATVIDDTPQQFINRDLSEYSPENYSQSYEGPLRLRLALVRSKNVVAVRVYERMKWNRINPIAERLLFMNEKRRNRTLKKEATVALGTHPMSPLEMARTYAVFASNGRSVYPHLLLYITDSSGRMLRDFRPALKEKKIEQIISPGTAQIITSMMQSAVTGGTGARARIPGREVAGKTGTTSRYRDAWFVGFTPQLVSAIHIGYDQGRSLGSGGTGGRLAASIWGRYMHEALKGEPPGRFHFAGSRAYRVEVCERSGKLPGPQCKDLISELFLPGTAPREICHDHGGPGGIDVPTIIESEEELIRGDF